MFSDPGNRGSALPEDAHRLVGDAGAGAEQESSDGGGGDVCGAVGILGGDRVGVAVDGAAFQVDEGDAFRGAGEMPRRESAPFTDRCHLSSPLTRGDV